MISERTQMRCFIKANLRQEVKATMPQDYETAFTICERDGDICRGNEGKGGPYAVSLNIGCPTGYKPIGIWHSHPKGTTDPSSADVSEMKKLRLRHMCISVPDTGEMKCHIVESD